LVVFGVGDLGFGERVIETTVTIDHPSEFGDAFDRSGIGRVHVRRRR
jgi:hypothetical protein